MIKLLVALVAAVVTFGCAAARAEDGKQFTPDEFTRLVNKYIADWQNIAPGTLWLSIKVMRPGEHFTVTLPDTFGSMEKPKAGMEGMIAIIALNGALKPERLFSTFLHEYGHLKYRSMHMADFNEVASEVAAILFSLEALDNEGLHDLARGEAEAVTGMAVEEPYKSAVAQIRDHPLWKKYAPSVGETK